MMKWKKMKERKKKKTIKGGLKFLHNKCSKYVIDFFCLKCPLKKVVSVSTLGRLLQFHLGKKPIWCCASTPSRLSAALLLGAHMGCAGFSEERGHLLALSSCNSSFLSQWSQSQISGRSQLQTHCWSARDCGDMKEKPKPCYFSI